MINVHEKVLQYFKKHNVGDDVKIKNLSENLVESELKSTPKITETSDEVKSKSLDATAYSSTKNSLISKLKELDEKEKGITEIKGLEEMEYTPLTEEEIKAKANEGMDEKYGVELDALANETAKKLNSVEKSNELLNANALSQKEKVEALYKDAQEKVENSAIKRGISRSSIVQEQIKDLDVEKIKDTLSIDNSLAVELKNNSDKISELETDYLIAVNKLNVKKALEISEKIEELTEKQNDKIEEVLKYNNTIKRQQASLDNGNATSLSNEEKRNIKKQKAEEALKYYMSLPTEQAKKELEEDKDIQLLLGDALKLVQGYVNSRS